MNNIEKTRSAMRELLCLDGTSSETAEVLYDITLEANDKQTTWKVSSFQFELESDTHYYVGCLVDGQIVGYIGCMIVTDEVSINNFAVLPAFKQQGIGSALLQQLINDSSEKGVRHFYLEVRVSNETAISLYKKFGFEKIAFRKDYYMEPAEDAYVLYLHKLEP